MNAVTKGHREGSAYMARFSIQTITYSGYIAMGRTTAKRRYSKQKAQDAYLEGWRAAGKWIQSMFKPDDADTSVILAKLEVSQRILEKQLEEVETMLPWHKDDMQVQTYLHRAYRTLEEAQDSLQTLMELLKDREH